MIDKDLLKLLGERKKYIFLSVVLQLLSMLTSLSITAGICCLIQYMIGREKLENYILPITCILLFMGIRYVFTRWNGSVKDKLGRQVKKDLRKQIYEKVIQLGIHSNEQMGKAGLTQVSMEGVEQLDLYYTSYIPQFFYAMLAPVILFFVTVGIQWQVACVLLGCVPLIPVSIILVSKHAKKIFAKYWDKYIHMGDDFLDSVQGLRELKIFKADEEQHQKMNQNAEEFRRVTMKVLVMQLASTTIMDFVAYGGAAFGISMVIISMNFWNLTPIKALFLVLIAVEFFLPMRAFGSAFHIAMNGASAGKQILSFLTTPVLEWGNKSVDKMDISLANVSFSYDGKREVLKDVNMKFPKNGMVAIVGPSGSGKSTVVNLLLGAYCPQKGGVKVGEKGLFSLNRESYYRHLAVVHYNSYLFHDTIRENFLMSREDMTEEEMYFALKRVNLTSFIEKNGGLDKMIGEDAENISGGEKQRLTLAIAMAANKDIYIFDEATSNIDIESEAIIMRNIRELSQRKNVIVISHRLENIIDADFIYYLENGKVKEEGCHEELLSRKEGYYNLYTAQKKLEQGYMEEGK